MSLSAYSFRDNYLDVHPGGNIYIGIYYGISNDFNYSQLDYSFAVTTVNLLGQFLPKTEDLTQNPHSSTVLLNISEAETIKTYLNNVKPYLLTQEAKNEVDFLIQKVTEWTGKTNYYITNNLATGYNL